MELSPAQKVTLKAAIAAETTPAFVTLRQVGDEQGMAEFYNTASTFTVWKSSVTITETGRVFNGAEWAGMTGANHTRLQTVAQYLSSYQPALADIRAMFNDIWSGAGGVLTRAALLLLWKRLATRGERIFATGTGTDVVPGLLVLEGQVTAQNISDALRS